MNSMNCRDNQVGFATFGIRAVDPRPSSDCFYIDEDRRQVLIELLGKILDRMDRSIADMKLNRVEYVKMPSAHGELLEMKEPKSLPEPLEIPEEIQQNQSAHDMFMENMSDLILNKKEDEAVATNGHCEMADFSSISTLLEEERPYALCEESTEEKKSDSEPELMGISKEIEQNPSPQSNSLIFFSEEDEMVDKFLFLDNIRFSGHRNFYKPRFDQSRLGGGSSILVLQLHKIAPSSGGNWIHAMCQHPHICVLWVDTGQLQVRNFNFNSLGKRIFDCVLECDNVKLSSQLYNLIIEILGSNGFMEIVRRNGFVCTKMVNFGKLNTKEVLCNLAEGDGESTALPRSYDSFGGRGSSGGGYDVMWNNVYDPLIEIGNVETFSQLDFREQLEAHFNRLPPSYVLDINTDRAEEVLLHQKLIARAKDQDNQPTFHIYFLDNVCTSGCDFDWKQISSAPLVSFSRDSVKNGLNSSKHWNCGSDYKICSKLEYLKLDVRKNFNDANREVSDEYFVQKEDVSHSPIHEIIFSTVDKPKLLSQLSELLFDLEFDIYEAHVFSAIDGYSLDVFVVDGWHFEDPKGLYNLIRKAIVAGEGSWSGSLPSQSIMKKGGAAHILDFYWRTKRLGKEIIDANVVLYVRAIYQSKVGLSLKDIGKRGFLQSIFEGQARQSAALSEVAESDDNNARSPRIKEIKDNSSRSPFQIDYQCIVFVPNLSLQVTDGDMHIIFADVGGVISILISKDKFTKNSIGLTNVGFLDDARLVAASQKNNQIFSGKKVYILKLGPHGRKGASGRIDGSEQGMFFIRILRLVAPVVWQRQRISHLLL